MSHVIWAAAMTAGLLGAVALGALAGGLRPLAEACGAWALAFLVLAGVLWSPGAVGAVLLILTAAGVALRRGAREPTPSPAVAPTAAPAPARAEPTGRLWGVDG